MEINCLIPAGLLKSILEATKVLARVPSALGSLLQACVGCINAAAAVELVSLISQKVTAGMESSSGNHYIFISNVLIPA